MGHQHGEHTNDILTLNHKDIYSSGGDTIQIFVSGTTLLVFLCIYVICQFLVWDFIPSV